MPTLLGLCGLNISAKEYCSLFHYVLSIIDMLNWKLYNNVFLLSLLTSGENDHVPYNDKRLSVPDCYERNGKYMS